MGGETMLKQAAVVFAEHSNQYGEPQIFFKGLVKRWSLTPRRSVTPDEVVRCLIDLKLTRLYNDPKHQDSGHVRRLDQRRSGRCAVRLEDRVVAITPD